MTRSNSAPGRWFQRALAGLFVVACVASWTLSAGAEDADDKAKRAQIISRTTMSPFCPGRTLESCPSPYATEWREDIREMVAKGMSTEEIRAQLETRTKTDLSGSPSTMLDGVLPALVTLVAILLLIFLLRKLVRSRRDEIQKMPGEAQAEDAKAEESPAADSKVAADSATDKALDERLRAELDNMENDSLDDR